MLKNYLAQNLRFLLALLMLPVKCHAQVVQVDTTGLNNLRQTTTLFLVPQGDSVLRDQYEQAIRSSWHFTPYEIIDTGALRRYADSDGYSYFFEVCKFPRPSHGDPMYTGPYSGLGMGGAAAVVAVGIVGALVESAIDEKYYFWQSPEGKLFDLPKGYYSIYTLCTQEPTKYDGMVLKQHVDIKMGTARGGEFYLKMRNKHADTDLSDSAIDPYWNPYWNPGLLKAYLQVVNDELTHASDGRQFLKRIDTPAVAMLRTDTLYIEDNVVNSLRAERHIRRDSLPLYSDVRDVYPFPYRFVTAQQLSELLMRPDAQTHFLTYTYYDDNDRAYYYKERKRYKKKYPKQHVNKGIKVYDASKGLIYANLPGKQRVLGRRRICAPFCTADLADLANAVNASHR